ncbi:DUF6376 family protein [Peribacillus deserti]|uniref:Lipoprotein n=1 Tax=Peribacillus deserti TaxID=673318 RepID=A0A2N5M7Z4_9BACI|nr:DUF6376 family protein [Peribacillus deserti]PLT30455.1 hypothetical protein CUU66_07270 [Peribacillus deserti]
MRKVFVVISIMAALLLSACSALGDINNSVEYAAKATENLTYLSNFAEKAPDMLRDAALNAEVKENLEAELASLKEDLSQFNDIEAVPALAKDLHQQLVTKNEAVITEINKVMENGQLTLDKLESSELLPMIKDVQSLLNQIEELGL